MSVYIAEVLLKDEMFNDHEDGDGIYVHVRLNGEVSVHPASGLPIVRNWNYTVELESGKTINNKYTDFTEEITTDDSDTINSFIVDHLIDNYLFDPSYARDKADRFLSWLWTYMSKIGFEIK